MINNNNDWEDKLLNNSLLFSSIRKNKTPEEKIKKIKKYLDRGADINASDANDKNNTPLHVAVMKEEPEVVIFLLERGALVNKKNSENQTALDIARLLHKFPKKYAIETTLEMFNNNQQDIVTDLDEVHAVFTKITEDKINTQPGAYNSENETQSNYATGSGLVINRNEVQSKEKHEIKKTKGHNLFNYQKRTGTSGLSGQLYETKLLTLILFRALYIQEVEEFTIATNVESMGAFDDIVFRFNSNKGDKPKIMFVQAKHRDNPEKEKFTVEEIMKLNGDFSLHKYLESYMKISQMFSPENSDDMFRGEFKNMDCEFIIYTSAFERFSKVKIVKQFQSQRFINTTSGIRQTVFQFDYDDDDVKLLMQTVAKSRAMHLAKRLSKYIFKDNHYNMMLDDLIKTYHVFLAQNILDIQDGETIHNFRYAKFQEIFFSSNDSLLLAFKATICKELTLLKKTISTENLGEVESILRSLTFKVPLNFGNLNFCFSGSEQKKEKRLEYLYSKFKQLFAIANVSENIEIKVDDDMVGPNKILKSTDLESYRLGGLVGNLLILDDETKTLKFNSDINSLSADNIKLYEKLRSDINIGIDKLSKYRFDINVHHFPMLSLIHDEYDKILINGFLDKLVFYTNQVTEGEVERIIKKEIDKYLVGSIPRQNDAMFRVKGDAIFLKVHDRVQKWWKKPIKAPYLTETCKYFFEAEQDILNSPLLSILNFTYIKIIKNALPALKFKNAAIELLHLDVFFGGSDKVLGIITEESALSSIKLIQYLNEKRFNDYTFIDLDYVGIGNYFVDVKSEVKTLKINTLIIICKSQDFVAEVFLLIKQFEGKVIIICNKYLSNQIKGLVTEDIIERLDSQTSFNDLADTMRLMLLGNCIVFQGKEVPLGILLNDESYHLITSNLLYMIIKNEKISVGNCLNNPAYDEILDFYINEQVCRYVTLDSNVKVDSKLNVIKYDEKGDISTPDVRDTILITDIQVEFEEYIKIHVNSNVHWFRFGDDKCLVWQKSQGSLLNLLKHIHRGSHDSYTLQPVTLKDFKDKVVIVSAEPGMGKSSLLTHLAINTKHKYPELWISKINLLENSKELRRMKEHKVNIDLKEAVQCLFRMIGFEGYKKSKAGFETMIDQVSVVDGNIIFNKNKVEWNITGLNLFEIELFIYCYNNDRVILLFDGFDEICPDFAKELMQLANILKKSKIVHLWITSRLYNVLNQLENTLETFSFTIKPLSYDNQLKFLEKIWLSKGSNKMLSCFPFNTNWGLEKAVKGFLNVLSAVLCDTNNKFISMPLHLYMISEIFQDSFHNFSLNPESMEDFVSSQNTMNMVNLNLLYERFVDVKFFKIRFGEKKPLLCINDPDMRKLIDNERIAFYNSHKIIAAYVIFGKTNVTDLFDNYEINEIRNFVERIKLGEEKTGIIEQIIQNEPKFVHYTFAEYFATEFLCDKLKSFHCKFSWWTYFINMFLQSDEGGPRRFFNAKLRNHPLLLNEMHNTCIKELFGNLLTQHVTLTKLIFMAIDEYLENSAIFLLKCLKTVLSKNNLDDFINVLTKNVSKRCIICIAAKRHAKEAVTFILQLVKDIDVNRLIDLYKCSDLPKCNPVVVAFEACKGLQPNVGLLDILLSDLPPPAIVELFCIQFDSKWFNSNRSKKLIHLTSWSLGDTLFNYFDKVLDKLNMEQIITIFSVRDSEMKLAAHRAASEQSYTFFDKLDSLLDRSNFKEICMTRDRSGLTPLHYFKYSKKDCEKLSDILDKVYEGNTNEKLKLIHFIGNKN